MCHNSGMKTTRQSSSDRRLSLLQAALGLFSTQGSAGTTTKAIAETSGVTEAMLFRHFRTKEELLHAVVEQFTPRPLFEPLPPAVHTIPVRPALELFLTRYFDAVWNNRVFLTMAFTTPRCEQGVFADTWTEFGKQTLYLYALLQERSDRKELKADIVAAADVISAAASGYLLRTLNELPEDWEAVRNGFVSNLLQVLFGGIATSER